MSKRNKYEWSKIHKEMVDLVEYDHINLEQIANEHNCHPAAVRCILLKFLGNKAFTSEMNAKFHPYK